MLRKSIKKETKKSLAQIGSIKDKKKMKSWRQKKV